MSCNLVQYVESQKEIFEAKLVDKQIKFEAESNFAIQTLQNNDYLAKVAASNIISLQNAILNVAAIGISLNPALKHAYLVPRENKVCLDISYFGLMHLAQITGAIEWVQCKSVYEKDEYLNNGVGNMPTHIYRSFCDRGALIGFYCVAKTKNGDYLSNEMSVSEVNKLRDRSQGYQAAIRKKNRNTPWITDTIAMSKKTVVRQGSKYWPCGERFSQAVEYTLTEAGEGINFEQEKEINNKVSPVDVSPATVQQLNEISSLLRDINETAQSCIERLIPIVLSRKVEDMLELTFTEADAVINRLKELVNANN